MEELKTKKIKKKKKLDQFYRIINCFIICQKTKWEIKIVIGKGIHVECQNWGIVFLLRNKSKDGNLSFLQNKLLLN